MNIEKMREEFEAAYLKDVSERFRGAEVGDDEWVARGSNGEYQSFRAAGAWWAWQKSRETIEPDFYWPDGDEGGSSSVEEMAQDAYGWDGSLWEDQDIACAHELPMRTYRSFLDDKGEVQVERIK